MDTLPGRLTISVTVAGPVIDRGSITDPGIVFQR